MHPQSSRFRTWRQAMARAEKEQDVGGLPDHALSRFQKRRSEWWCAFAPLHHFHHRRHAAAAARYIGIIGAGLLQRQPDIFAAALDVRPVIQFVAHGKPPSIAT